MTKTLLLCGYGPGISAAIARKFGREGFAVALVARSADRLEIGVAALRDSGIRAEAFPCDLGDPDAVARLVADVRAQLGPIHTIHWNAYASGPAELTNCTVEELRSGFDVAVSGLVVAVQGALSDLEAQRGAVLVTGGGFGAYSEQVDQMALQWKMCGLALMKSVQHKLTGLLHQELKSRGIYVGSIVVRGMVKGTAFAGKEGLEPDDIAQAFWRLAQARGSIYEQFPAADAA